MRADYVSIVEAAYRVDIPARDWMQSLCERARASLDDGLGIFTLAYEWLDAGRIAITVEGTGIWTEERSRELAKYTQLMCESYPEVIPGIFGGGSPAALAQDLQASLPAAPGAACRALLKAHGMPDALGVRGHDPSGRGVVLCAPLRRRAALPARARSTLNKVGTHLAAAVRLRGTATMPIDASEAIFGPQGKCLHATDEPDARARLPFLRSGVERLVQSRKVRKEEPERAVELWHSLVAGRWSVFDRFDSDGRRFICASRNEPAVTDPRALTPEERRVACYASWGHSQKLIAYELGLSEPTVSHHLKRCLQKLGLKHRSELLALLGQEPRGQASRSGRGGGDA